MVPGLRRLRRAGANEKSAGRAWRPAREHREGAANLGEVLGRYRQVLVPELNMGQLAMLIRARFPAEVVQINKVQGRPFTVGELLNKIRALTTKAAEA